jgi:hypothetical protein
MAGSSVSRTPAAGLARLQGERSGNGAGAEGMVRMKKIGRLQVGWSKPEASIPAPTEEMPTEDEPSMLPGREVPQAQVGRSSKIRRMALPVAAVVLAGLGYGVFAWTQGPATATRFSSARQVIAALNGAGLHCTGAYYGTPVVSGASSEASCNYSGAQASALIDVFPGNVTTAKVLHNSVSTGTQKIWSDVGPNWWVQADHPYAKRVQQALGGRIIGGPWHPQTAAAAPAAAEDPLQTWCDGSGGAANNAVLADLNQIGTDATNQDLASVEADGTQLAADAIAASAPLPPLPRHQKFNYGLAMGYFLVAGHRLSTGDVTGGSAALKKADHLINLDSGAFDGTSCQ